jgi:hypothetical protein
MGVGVLRGAYLITALRNESLFNRWSLVMLMLAIGLTYPASYALLSIQGDYMPGLWGLDGPKSYSWAPLGFQATVAG